MGHRGKNIEGQNNTRLMFPMEREQMERKTAVPSNWGYDVGKTAEFEIAPGPLRT